MGPAMAAGLTLASGIINSAFNAREARKNREFQERMSSTAHQREVRDLKLAGINPMMRSMSGASSPSGDRAEVDIGGDRAVSSGLQARMAQAQVELVKAQTRKTEDDALLSRTQAGAIQQEWQMGKGERLMSEAQIAALDVRQREQMLPLVLQRARAEIESMMSSAQAARARAMLDKAALQGALNLEAFEARIGEAGPAVKMLHFILRSLK